MLAADIAVVSILDFSQETVQPLRLKNKNPLRQQTLLREDAAPRRSASSVPPGHQVLHQVAEPPSHARERDPRPLDLCRDPVRVLVQINITGPLHGAAELLDELRVGPAGARHALPSA